MGATEYTAAVLADSPFLFYKFDDPSGLPQDSSGNGRNATSVDGLPLYRQLAPFTDAFSMRSVNSSQINRTPSGSTATDNMTMEAWWRLDGAVAANNSGLFNIGNATSGFGVFVDIDQTFQVILSAGGGTAMTNSVATLSTSNFRHVVITRDAGTWKYYVDGVLDTANAGTGAPANPTTQPLQFGQDLSANYGHYYSNCAYYATVLSAARVAAHYTAAIPQGINQLVAHLGGRGGGW